MIEALRAEFILMTEGFRRELGKVVTDIGKVGAALNALGAGGAGLGKVQTRGRWQKCRWLVIRLSLTPNPQPPPPPGG